MKKFPSKLSPSNIELFQDYYVYRQTCYLRKEIYEWMLSPSFFKDGERCFDLQMKGYGDDIINVLCQELNDMGWKTRLAFNNSSLYVYREGEDPCKFVGMFEEI